MKISKETYLPDILKEHGDIGDSYRLIRLKIFFNIYVFTFLFILINYGND